MRISIVKTLLHHKLLCVQNIKISISQYTGLHFLKFLPRKDGQILKSGEEFKTKEKLMLPPLGPSLRGEKGFIISKTKKFNGVWSG